jgi:hypothetical protein
MISFGILAKLDSDKASFISSNDQLCCQVILGGLVIILGGSVGEESVFL